MFGSGVVYRRGPVARGQRGENAQTGFVCGLLLATLAAWSAVPAAAAAVIAYKAILSGAGEVPAVETRGIGAAAVNADPASKQVSWRVEYTDLGSPAIAAEIICAAEVGVRGAGIAVALATRPT